MPWSSSSSIATTGSLKTQNPEALAGMAWCSPPEMLRARSASPASRTSTALIDAPVDSAEASYMPS